VAEAVSIAARLGMLAAPGDDKANDGA